MVRKSTRPVHDAAGPAAVAGGGADGPDHGADRCADSGDARAAGLRGDTESRRRVAAARAVAAAHRGDPQ